MKPEKAIHIRVAIGAFILLVTGAVWFFGTSFVGPK
jgi:hypothetical protein